jgi:hypothetical protein
MFIAMSKLMEDMLSTHYKNLAPNTEQHKYDTTSEMLERAATPKGDLSKLMLI